MEQNHEHHDDMTPWGNGHMREEECEVCHEAPAIDEWMGTLMCEACYDGHISSANANTLGELRADISYDESADRFAPPNFCKYPEVHVQLVGEDGNAFSIIARVTSAMKRAGIAPLMIQAFVSEATTSDYTNLLKTVMLWVNVDCDMPECDDDVDTRYYCGWCEERHEDCTCCDEEDDELDEEV